MIITYIRSSSFNCHSGCPQAYFIEYALGWRGKSNKAADMGTICHKVLEVLAWSKLHKQHGQKSYKDEIAGNVIYDKINIEKITTLIFTHYSKSLPHHTWEDKDLNICKKLVQIAQTHNNGDFNPLNRNIVAIEKEFDIVLDFPWAKFDYTVDGQKIQGQVALKGTIDLITEVGNGFYEFIDWKTGARKDWNTGEVKDHAKLSNDIQLMIYHYAVHKCFPDINLAIPTIFFLKDGGPYTIHFDDETLKRTEEALKYKISEIKNTQIPRLVKSWKCRRLCDAGKTTFEGTSITPIVEFRKNATTPYGQFMTKCEQIAFCTKKHGHDWVMQNLKNPNNSFKDYKAPGTI